MNIGLGSLQVVIFVNAFDLSDKLSTAQIFSKIKSLTFDSSPTILPLPPDAPVELPRIILKSENKLFNLNISSTRLDLFYNHQKTDKEGTPVGKVNDIETVINQIVYDLISILTNKFNAKVPRLALVSNNVIKLDISSVQHINDNYFKKNPIKDSVELQLNFLNNADISNIKSNIWTRFHSLRKLNNLKDNSALLFVLDINSLAETDNNFNTVSAKQYFKECFTKIKEELNKFSK